jgi:putative ABC transport system permease protein
MLSGTGEVRMLNDARHALRRLATAPLFTGLVVLTLCPGIGANVAIFDLVTVLFLRPLPLADAGRLVGGYQTRVGQGYFPLSLPDYADYRAASTAFSGLASHYPTAPLSLSHGDASEEINGSVVSANYFSVLGVKPARGRFFVAAEDGALGGAPVVVVSYRFWQARLGGRAAVLGQRLRLNGTPCTIVGVAPPSFTGVLLGIPSDVWLPNSMAAVGYRWCDARRRDCTWLSLIGRLRPGRSLAGAQAEMSVLSRRLRQAYPATDDGRGLRLAPLRGVHPAARLDTARLAALLVCGAMLGFAVACANLASLLLARGLTRRTEIAVKLALGASRLRVISPVVAEALLLALAGGIAGALVAPALGHVLAAVYPSDVPLDLPLDLAALGYACGLSILVGLIVGLVPGLQSTRPDLVAGLKDGAVTTRHGRPRALGALIAFQVALSFVLLVLTGLLVRSLAGAGAGFDPAGVVALRLRPLLIDRTAVQAQAFSREALVRLAAVPGVRSASLAVTLPPWEAGDPSPVELPGRRAVRPRGEAAAAAAVDWIAPRLFQTLQVPVLLGRDFGDRDAAGEPPVAMVSRTLARRLWPHDSPIGRRLVLRDTTYEVVGLVPDVGYRNALQAQSPHLYLAYWQNAKLVDARLCVRVAGDPLRAVPALLRVLRAMDPAVPITEVEPVTGSIEKFLAPVRVAGRLLGLSAGVGTLLSAVGLFGVLSLAVAQRRRDIGIRMALGADRRRVVAAVVRDASVLVAAALVLGLAGALAASRLVGHYLYGVGPYDPLTFAAAAALLALTAAFAAWLPARQASRIDAIEALRHM